VLNYSKTHVDWLFTKIVSSLQLNFSFKKDKILQNILDNFIE